MDVDIRLPANTRDAIVHCIKYNKYCPKKQTNSKQLSPLLPSQDQFGIVLALFFSLLILHSYRYFGSEKNILTVPVKNVGLLIRR